MTQFNADNSGIPGTYRDTARSTRSSSRMMNDGIMPISNPITTSRVSNVYATRLASNSAASTGRFQVETGWAPSGSTSGKSHYDTSSTTTIVFSVWDGDWELIEEYGPGNVMLNAYLQGAHGPIKSLLSNIYYYQDSLGSTSHIANAAGALLEYYKYDLNGKPTYWSPSNPQPQLSASAFGINDLFAGERYVTEIGLYDDRNRFMSPDLGRFLQPDPIGFKGDASNLYRYCGNDWANKTDPMGLDVVPSDMPKFEQKEEPLTLEFQKQQTVTGSNIPRWTTVYTATFTKSGNWSRVAASQGASSRST